jgi:NAD(P)H-dependent FMN reductase
VAQHALRLGIIIASVRPGRVGDKVGSWLAEQAANHGDYDVDVIDLAEVDLPAKTDEPSHPLHGHYIHDYTWAWSARVSACQAFVIVTPEYNHGYPAALKNALDLVNMEWWYKPVGFASYGGVSGGLRAVQQLKQVVTVLRMIPVAEAFIAPHVAEQITQGRFTPTAAQVAGTKALLDELLVVGKPLSHLHRHRPENLGSRTS